MANAQQAPDKRDGSPKLTPGQIVVLVWLAVTAVFATWGFIQGFVFSYADGWYGNYYTTIWISSFAWVLCIQAGLVFCKPALTTAHPARFWVWQAYAFWMFSCCLILLVGLGIALTGQFPWAFLWLPPVAIIAYGSFMHKRQAAGQPYQQRVDVEAGAQQPSLLKTTWSYFVQFLGWSSIFWLVGLSFFLALQAAWLAADFKAYPAPGQVVAVPLDDSTIVPNMHIYCTGKKTPGLATIVVDAGTGTPGQWYDDVVSKLAAGDRRACWYDRLGYGWSSEAIKPAVSNTRALKSLLTRSGETGPFILVGHGSGGQTALLFAAWYPSLTAGVALVDSYDNVVASAQDGNTKNVTVTLADGTSDTKPIVIQDLDSEISWHDFMRAVTPFGFARFGSNSLPVANATTALRNSLFGSNKYWHTRWLLWASQKSKTFLGTSDALASAANKRSFQGVGWPSLGSKPVLLMPAARTLDLPGGCDAAGFEQGLSDCVYAVNNNKGTLLGQLYWAYNTTLSSKTKLSVVPHYRTIWEEPEKVAVKVLGFFQGV